MGHKNLVKPTSLTNAAAIDRNVVCQKFVALHPRRMTAFHFWSTRVSKIFLFAPISSILWRFKSLQCYCCLIAMFWAKPKTT